MHFTRITMTTVSRMHVAKTVMKYFKSTFKAY